jgi:hypothetical protein
MHNSDPDRRSQHPPLAKEGLLMEDLRRSSKSRLRRKLIPVLCLCIVLAAGVCFFVFESVWPPIRIFGWAFGIVLAWLALFLGRILAGSTSGISEEEIANTVGRMALCLAVIVLSSWLMFTFFYLLVPDCRTSVSVGIIIVVASVLAFITWKYAIVRVK